MEKELSMDDRFLGKIFECIEDNLGNENFTVEDLAEMAGVSRSMLHRRLIRLTCKSASDLITEKRLMRAKEMLEQNAATASEIAYKVGFRSPSYFNKVFRKHFKVSPGKLRKIASFHLNHGILTEEKPRPRFYFPGSVRINRRIQILLISIILITVPSYIMIKRYYLPEHSIAVLPLHNLTGHPEFNFLAESLHDELIGELGQIAAFRVISRTSTLKYRNVDMLLKDIATDLGVNTIVEGSLIQEGDTLRLLIQLIAVFPKERHLVANEYYDIVRNGIIVQSLAAKQIAQKIKHQLD